MASNVKNPETDPSASFKSDPLDPKADSLGSQLLGVFGVPGDFALSFPVGWALLVSESLSCR